MAKSPLLTGVSQRATIAAPKLAPTVQPIKVVEPRMVSAPKSPLGPRAPMAARPVGRGLGKAPQATLGGRKRNY